MKKYRMLKTCRFYGVMFLLFVGMMIPMKALAKTQTVNNENEFMNALADESIERIVLSDTIDISRSMDGLDNAFVIPRSVTISGGGLRLERAGIVLGASVSFEDTVIYFSNPVRNAVIANGHELHLKNVTNGGSSYGIFIFCGGITDYNGGNASEIPASGTKGAVIIQGTNDLEDIFAGSFSDVDNQVQDVPNDFCGDAVISIENGAAGFGEIYAHGAKENRSGGYANVMIPDADLYTVSGTVRVELKTHKGITLHGKTGGTKDADFIYTDNGKGYACSPSLTDIGSISLYPADNGSQANLVVGKESSFSSKGTAFSVPENTILNLTETAERMKEPEIDTLQGGGILILKNGQMLKIRGQVSGNTRIAVDGLTYSQDESTGYLEEGQNLLQAESSSDSSFTLLAPSMNPAMMIARDARGYWTVTTSGITTLIQSASIEDCQAEAENEGVEIPVKVIYASDGLNLLAFVPVNIAVNGTDARMGQDEYGYYYIADTSDAAIEFYFTEDSYGNEILYIVDLGYETGVVPEGTYHFELTIPGSYMKNGVDFRLKADLTVGEPEPTPTQTPEPTPTQTPEPTPTQTPEPTPTQTPEPTPTQAPEPTPTQTPEPTLTQTPEPTPTQTPEPTPTQTPEPTPTQTPEPTPTQTPEPTPTQTPEPTPTQTPEPTPTQTPEPTPTQTPEPTPTQTPEPTPTQAPSQVEDIFDDIFDDWYLDYVQYVFDHGLMTGIKGTRLFAPDGNVTKAQVAQVLYNMEEQPESGKKVFQVLKDVYEAEWYASAVAWAYENGVVTGDLNTMTFLPNQNITREQLALMLYRYSRYKGYDAQKSADFTGMTGSDRISSWAYEGMNWAVASGLISGIETEGVKELAPQGTATRAQMAAILQRFSENIK